MCPRAKSARTVPGTLTHSRATGPRPLLIQLQQPRAVRHGSSPTPFGLARNAHHHNTLRTTIGHKKPARHRLAAGSCCPNATLSFAVPWPSARYLFPARSLRAVAFRQRLRRPMVPPQHRRKQSAQALRPARPRPASRRVREDVRLHRRGRDERPSHLPRRAHAHVGVRRARQGVVWGICLMPPVMQGHGLPARQAPAAGGAPFRARTSSGRRPRGAH